MIYLPQVNVHVGLYGENMFVVFFQQFSKIVYREKMLKRFPSYRYQN